MLFKDNIVLIYGELSNDDDKKRLIVSSVSDVNLSNLDKQKILIIKLKSKRCKKIGSVLKILEKSRGNCLVKFFFEDEKLYCTNKLLPYVDISETLLENLEKIVGKGAVKINYIC